MSRAPRSRLRKLVAVSLVVLGVSPITAPFSTYDLADHHTRTDRTEILAAKLLADEDLAIIGTPLGAETASPLSVLADRPAGADGTSKHQIPSRILRL